MSDLFKDQRPELSDDEDRRLWQRVRAIPDEVAATPRREPARAPWWRALWAMPAVRYGAPALAVLLVAVVWVTERRPTPPARTAAERMTPHALNGAPHAQMSPPVTREPDVPVQGSDAARSSSRSIRARAQENRESGSSLLPQQKSALDEAAKDEIKAQESAPTPPGYASRLRVMKKESAVPAPQAEPQPAPTPAPTSSNQTFAAPPRSTGSAAPQVAPAAPKASAPAPSNWGSTRANYRDSGPGAQGTERELSLGGFPSQASLARHDLVALALDTPDLGPIDFWGSLPKGTDWGPDSKAWIHVVVGPDGPPHVTFVPTKLLRRFGPGADYEYEAAPPRVQAALLAALLERALLDPTTVPRHRIEELLEAARRVKRRGGAGQGIGVLVRTVETLLESWPTTR